MGYTDMMFGAIGSSYSSVVDFGLQAIANSVLPLSKAQRQQNEFNAGEAQKARDFSAQQAEISRDWQEEQNARYNSLSGKIAQAREAGVNPMLAVTGGAVSPASASSPSVAAPAASGGSASSVGQISDVAGAMLGFSKIRAEIENIRSATRQQNANALKTELDSLWVDKLNSQTIKESNRLMQSYDVSDAEKIANTQLLVKKAITEDATNLEKLQNVSYIAQLTKNSEAQYGAILAGIKNTEQDSALKAAQTGLVLLEQNSERIMPQLLKSEYYLNKEQRNKIIAETRSIRQKYDHDEIMNGYTELLKFYETNHEGFWNGHEGMTQVASELLQYMKSIIGIFAGTTTTIK